MSADLNAYEPGVLRVFQSKEETRSFYNKIAHVYDLFAEHTEKPMREAGLKMLGAKAGESVLEVGFGTGHCLVDLAGAVGPKGTILGIDISATMLAESERLLTEQGLADIVVLQRGDAEQFPYDSESIDAIFSSFTLELFDTPDLLKVLTEWRRVLKPGGRLVVVGVSKKGPQGVILKAFEWTHKHFPNLINCRPIYVRRALKAAGFQIREAVVDRMWVPVEIVLAHKP